MHACPVEIEAADAILDAMERLLGRFGYKKTTMEDVAREAGIGKGTIYLHFPSKEELALRSIDRVVRRVQDRLQAIAADGSDVAQRLRQMIIERVLLRFDSVADYSQSLDDLFESIRPAYMSRRQRYFEIEVAVFAPVLEEGRRRKLLAVTDARLAAYTLILATNSLLPYSLSARELGKRAEVEKQVRRIADLLLNGLLIRSTTKHTPFARKETLP
jgi:AcrR family transcriptional regulator